MRRRTGAALASVALAGLALGAAGWSGGSPGTGGLHMRPAALTTSPSPTPTYSSVPPLQTASPPPPGQPPSPTAASSTPAAQQTSPPSAAAGPLVLTWTDDGRTVQLRQGQELVVDLRRSQRTVTVPVSSDQMVLTPAGGQQRPDGSAVASFVGRAAGQAQVSAHTVNRCPSTGTCAGIAQFGFAATVTVLAPRPAGRQPAAAATGDVLPRTGAGAVGALALAGTGAAALGGLVLLVGLRRTTSSSTQS